MTDLLQRRGKAVLEEERLEELRVITRTVGGLWYLLTKYLNYGFNPRLSPPRGLTLEWHKPVCDWLDWHRDTPKLAMWCRRGWHKTTIEVGLCLQEWLRDPMATHRIWTGGPDLSSDITNTLASHVRDNDELRALDPVGVSPKTGKPFKGFPSKAKKFSTYQQGSGSVKMSRCYGYMSRGATFRIATAATEGTGSHVDGIGMHDDIIGRNTVERSGLQGIAQWFRSTPLNVVDSKRHRSFATPWSDNSIHQEWMVDDEWTTLILPGAISESHGDFVEMIGNREKKKLHFTPCYKFSNPTFWPPEWDGKARKQLKKDQHGQKGNFPPQVMCDPEPEAEKPWGKDCENFTGIQKTDQTPGVGGPGRIFVLSDPAPLHSGSVTGITEKIRGDGTKDYWSLSVWKLRPRGEIMDFILLAGEHSQEWTQPAGCAEAARLMKYWKTNLFFSEAPDMLHEDMKTACMQTKASLRKMKDGRALRFKEYNKADGKNVRFTALAAKAREGEVWICSETCSDDFLYGDREHTGVLTQSRKWRKIGHGKNSLRFDDDADCCSRVTDAALLEFAPRPGFEQEHRSELAAIFGEDNTAAGASQRSRYCGF